MPRKKKEDVPNINEIDFSTAQQIDKVYLTEEQMSEYKMLYASSLNKQLQGVYQNLDSQYNPYLSQDFIQSINISPQKPNQKDLTSWLENPSKYQKQLRDVGQYLQNVIMQYNRSIKHFQSALTYKYELIPCQEIKSDNKEKVLSTRNKANNLLRKLNIKYQFEKIGWNIVQNGVVYYFVKDTKDFKTLFELPKDYCYITGTHDLGFTFCVDLTFFERIRGMEKALPEMYEVYNMFLQLKDAGMPQDQLIQYQFYPLTPDKGWVFVFDPTKVDLTPPLKGTFKDAFEITSYKDLLRTKTMLDTVMLLVQQIPYDKDSKKFIMEYKDAQQIVTMAQSQLPRGVRTIATPFDPTLLNFTASQSQNNIIGLGESNYWNATGVSETMMGESAKSALTLDYSLEGDVGFIDHIYRQFDNFVNVQLAIECSGFKWQVKFFGNRYKDDKRMEAYGNLMQSKNMPVSKLFAYLDYEPFQYESLIDYEALTNIKGKLQPILNGNQMSSADVEDKGGRPNGIETESGENTREHDSNENAMKS